MKDCGAMLAVWAGRQYNMCTGTAQPRAAFFDDRIKEL
ncbi:hypothetical protein HMPREF1147_1245 [Selenomonas sp. FOBRC9]|nr:hypothetical protein HMPREF1147_1245 [Selenomonas sp. FOBRC9]